MDASSLRARLDRRLIPLLLGAYVVNFLDRVNVGFAALQLDRRLGFGPDVFGLGAGIFFIGYLLFEVPSNMVLVRVGARFWLARIMLSWGVVSAATVFVQSPLSFYVLRFLLGVAEAGFVPALLVLINDWYPPEHRAGAVAKVWSATAIALVIGAPLSTGLLALDGVAGLAGWRWLFLVEAAPALLLGLVFARWLPDAPADARWLSPDERAWFAATAGPAAPPGSWRADLVVAAGTGRVWVLSGLYCCLGVGFFGVTLWLPQIVRQLGGLSDTGAAAVSALPFVLATGAMVAWAAHSDRTRERKWHVVGGAALAAAGFATSAVAGNAIAALAALCVGAVGLWSVIGIFWQLPAGLLGGRAAAVGVAIINASGSLGGFVGPYLIGVLRRASGAYALPMLAIAAAMAAAALIAALIARPEPTGRVAGLAH